MTINHVPGVVNPGEYDWTTQFDEGTLDGGFVEMDSGKVRGLAIAYEQSLARITALESSLAEKEAECVELRKKVSRVYDHILSVAAKDSLTADETMRLISEWAKIGGPAGFKLELESQLAAKDKRIVELEAKLTEYDKIKIPTISADALLWVEESGRREKAEEKVAALQAQRERLAEALAARVNGRCLCTGGSICDICKNGLASLAAKSDPATELSRRLDEARREANQKVVDYLRLCWRCTCHEAYKDRGMTAPDCFRCDLEPELLGIEAEARKSEGDPA